MVEDAMSEIVQIYLDGKYVDWGVLEVRPKTAYSNGMPIVQNIYMLYGKEVYLEKLEGTKIYLRSER